MSFSSSIILTDGTTPRTVDTISVVNSDTLRRDATEGLFEPFTMRISTTAQNDGSNRHLVRCDKVKVYDTDTGAKDLASVYMVIVAPTTSDQETEIQWQVKAIADFLSTANVTKLLNGES